VVGNCFSIVGAGSLAAAVLAQAFGGGSVLLWHSYGLKNA
jgi:hypothetical protein